ncbi:MAG: class I adenylate-forming enzyme family protein [Bacillota bacterium]
MNKSTPLYTVDGEPFNERSLQYLKASFEESYSVAIQKYAQLPFLKVYGKERQFLDKTFAEFHGDVERVRCYLLSDFLDCEVIITVDNNTYENIVFMTAAILGGFTLSPLSPNDGGERISRKIKQIGRKYSLFVGKNFQALRLEKSHSLEIPTNSYEFQANKIRPKNVAAILIFTSGTTGYSKIVQQSEVGILLNSDALIELHGLSERKVIATPLPIYHVNALEFSFLCSLFSGQRLVLYNGFDFATILESLKEDKVQILSIVPHALKSLLDLRQKVLSATNVLEYCVTAASSLSPELAKRLSLEFPFKIIQGYGLSEAINFSLINKPSDSKTILDYWLTHFKRPSIGTPLRGNEVRILSEAGEVLGEGEEGEICIRGPGIMFGYMDQDNSEIFAGDYLHTGDRGFFYIREDTLEPYFFITGRQKDVIKRFGLTISLIEIDDILTRWLPPKNITAIAVPFLNETAGEEIGIAVSGDVTEEDLNSLQNYLTENVPSFMRPRVIAVTEAKLRTDSGKPQRWVVTNLFEEFCKTIFSEKIRIKKSQ